MFNINRINESFHGSNNIRYKHIYYIAELIEDTELTINPKSSENKMVLRCIKNKTNCFTNLAIFLKKNNVDIIGLQECLSEHINRFCNYLGSNYDYFMSNDSNSSFFPPSTGVVYNKNKTGPCIKLNIDPTHKLLDTGVRGISTVYFKNKHLLFSSIWFDHTHNKIKSFELINNLLIDSISTEILSDISCSRSLSNVNIIISSSKFSFIYY